MKRVFKLRLAYDGTNYCGWQRQVKQKTVEGELIKACEKIFTNPFCIYGASRTDSGVHAIGQIASLEIETDITPYKLRGALNANLPKDIVVQEVEEAEIGFHARYGTKEKTYIYKIYNNDVPLPQYARDSYYYHKPLDLEKMKAAAAYFLGEHDFMAFSSLGSSFKTSNRHIYKLNVTKKDGMIEILVNGNGFLYNMVRIIAGTLIWVGTGRIRPEDIPSIIESKDRKNTGHTAPALGLTLMEVKY